MSVQLYVHEKYVGLVVTCFDEQDFQRQFCELLTGYLAPGGAVPPDDQALFLEAVLPQFVEVCLAFRGYKTANVLQKVTYVSGDMSPLAHPVAEVTDPSFQGVDSA